MKNYEIDLDDSLGEFCISVYSPDATEDEYGNRPLLGSASFTYDAMPGNCGIEVAVDLNGNYETAEVKELLLSTIKESFDRQARGKILFSDNTTMQKPSSRNGEITWWDVAEYLGAQRGSIARNPRHDTRIVVWEYDTLQGKQRVK